MWRITIFEGVVKCIHDRISIVNYNDKKGTQHSTSTSWCVASSKEQNGHGFKFSAKWDPHSRNERFTTRTRPTIHSTSKMMVIYLVVQCNEAMA